MGDVTFRTGVAPAAASRPNYAARFDASYQLPSTLDLLVDIFEENASNPKLNTGIVVTVVRTDGGALPVGVYVIKAVAGASDLPSGVTAELIVYRKVPDTKESSGFKLEQVNNSDGTPMEVNELLERAITNTPEGRSALYKVIASIKGGFAAASEGRSIIDISDMVDGRPGINPGAHRYKDARTEIAKGYMRVFLAEGKTALDDFDADFSFVLSNDFSDEFDTFRFTPTGKEPTTVGALRTAFEGAKDDARSKFDIAKAANPQTEEVWKKAYAAALEAQQAYDVLTEATGAATEAKRVEEQAKTQQKLKEGVLLSIGGLPVRDLDAVCEAAEGNFPDVNPSITNADTRALILRYQKLFIALGNAYLKFIQNGDLKTMPASPMARNAIAAALSPDARIVEYTTVDRTTGKKVQGSYLGIFVKDAKSNAWSLVNPQEDVPAEKDWVGRVGRALTSEDFTITEEGNTLTVELNPTWMNRQCRVDNDGAIVPQDAATALVSAKASVTSSTSGDITPAAFVAFLGRHGVRPDVLAGFSGDWKHDIFVNSDGIPVAGDVTGTSSPLVSSTSVSVDLSNGLNFTEWKALGLGTDQAFLLWAQAGRASAVEGGKVKGDLDTETITLEDFSEMERRTVLSRADVLAANPEEKDAVIAAIEKQYLGAKKWLVVDKAEAASRMLGSAGTTVNAEDLLGGLKDSVKPCATIIIRKLVQGRLTLAASGDSVSGAEAVLDRAGLEMFFDTMAFLLQCDEPQAVMGLPNDTADLPELESGKTSDLMKALFSDEYLAEHEELKKDETASAAAGSAASGAEGAGGADGSDATQEEWDADKVRGKLQKQVKGEGIAQLRSRVEVFEKFLADKQIDEVAITLSDDDIKSIQSDLVTAYDALATKLTDPATAKYSEAIVLLNKAIELQSQVDAESLGQVQQSMQQAMDAWADSADAYDQSQSELTNAKQIATRMLADSTFERTARRVLGDGIADESAKRKAFTDFKEKVEKKIGGGTSTVAATDLDSSSTRSAGGTTGASSSSSGNTAAGSGGAASTKKASGKSSTAGSSFSQTLQSVKSSASSTGSMSAASATALTRKLTALHGLCTSGDGKDANKAALRKETLLKNNLTALRANNLGNAALVAAIDKILGLY